MSIDAHQRAKALLAELAVLNRYVARQWAQMLEEFEGSNAAIVAHRRMGKTIGVLNVHKRNARNDVREYQRFQKISDEEGLKFSDADIRELLRGRQYAHILPTKVQARQVAWAPLKWYCGNVPGVDFNESLMRVQFPATSLNPMGSAIQLFGADDPDSMRGFAFWGVSYDEYSQMDPTLHGEVISKSLADHAGYAWFLGTLKGKNHLYRLYQEAKKNPKWFALWRTLEDSLKLEKGATIALLQRAYREDLEQMGMGLQTQEWIDQEWHLSTVAAVHGAYYSKQIGRATRENRIGDRARWDPALPVYDVWDIGKGPQLKVGIFQRSGKWVQMIHAFSGTEQDSLPEMVRTLREESAKRGWVFGKHFAPHDIKATEFGTGETRINTAKNLGWEFTEVPRMSVDDGIALGQAMFDRAYISEEGCQLFLDAIGQYKQGWDEKRGVFTGVPVHDWTSHDADMWRYAAVAEPLMTNELPTVSVVAVMPVHGTSSGWTG